MIKIRAATNHLFQILKFFIFLFFSPFLSFFLSSSAAAAAAAAAPALH